MMTEEERTRLEKEAQRLNKKIIFTCTDQDLISGLTEIMDAREQYRAMAYDYASALEKIAKPVPDSDLEYVVCGCEESKVWMSARRFSRDTARTALNASLTDIFMRFKADREIIDAAKLVFPDGTFDVHALEPLREALEAREKLK